jgi:hypothetical protein
MTPMNGVLTIDAFHAQLTSSSGDSLLEAVRKLMTVEKDELLTMLEETLLVGWSGWYV